MARRGELVSSLDHPTLLAKGDDELVGVATYVIDAGECELLTLHAHRQFQGIGTALADAVEQLARQAGCARVWLVTTNDNVDALRFYQRRGFALCAVRPQAMNWSRQTWKPEIPTTGSHGIELRDELEGSRAGRRGLSPGSSRRRRCLIPPPVGATTSPAAGAGRRPNPAAGQGRDV